MSERLLSHHCRGTLLVAALLVLPVGVATAAPPTELAGLEKPARVVRDGYGVAHIYASTDLDAIRLEGYVHAQDRFFQMDYLRRLFSGRAAELVGPAALSSDVQLRTLGLRRAAEASWNVLEGDSRTWLEAYAQGVNAYLANNPLPPEYGALELTRGSVPVWSPVDSLTLAKGLAFGLSFDLDDLDRTTALIVFQLVGGLAGFDGSALFFEDLYRSASFDQTVSIPGVLGGADAKQNSALMASVEGLSERISPRVVALAQRYLDEARQNPILSRALHRADGETGSNWWTVSGDLSASGYPMLANDPHLSLDVPTTLYEVHLMAFDPGRQRPLNANGVSFAGAPGLAQGCNHQICWGSTVNPMDVTDVFQEEIVFDPATGLPAFTRYGDQLEPLLVLPQSYIVNSIGDGIPDNLADSGLPFQDTLVLVVPRRNNGPIIGLDASQQPVLGLSVQYTGWGPTRELDAFRMWLRAVNLDDFKEGLQYFDVGSQNWGYADVGGNIAYFTSAEMPLREDLQLLNQPDGTPPFLVRDGTGQFRNEWLPATTIYRGQSLPYEILPFEEMPQVVNPAAGYIINANNDPIGTTNDNNPLNQLRPGGGLYYLSPGYSDLRSGRIARLIGELAAEGNITPEDLMAVQANNQLLDAELLVGHIFTAWNNANTPGAPAELAALGADPDIIDTIGYLGFWNYSTPTGIPEGYDPGDDPDNLPAPSQEEIDYSVAATIYSVWRSQMIRLVIDEPLAAIGLADLAPDGTLAFRAMARQLEEFDTLQGVGSSGLPFFDLSLAPTPEGARDITILGALRSALDLLASDDFAAAFHNSHDLSDYRWGYLHRITFDHPLGGPFSVPPAGGYSSVAADLPGIARSGGFGSVDAASHNPRAARDSGFMFGSGPSRRFVGVMTPGAPDAYQVIPGGVSGVLGSPDYAGQLGLWLTNHYHPLLVRSQDVQTNRVSRELFTPAN